MTSYIPPETQLLPLLQAFRNMSPSRQPNMLALEVFLLCAEAPKTYNELEERTGCHRRRIEKAITLITVQVRDGEVFAPGMHLLKAQKIQGTTMLRFSITDRGPPLACWQGVSPIVRD